jgi:hypothetical protein
MAAAEEVSNYTLRFNGCVRARSFGTATQI